MAKVKAKKRKPAKKKASAMSVSSPALVKARASVAKLEKLAAAMK